MSAGHGKEPGRDARTRELAGWGMRPRARCRVYEIWDPADLPSAFHDARERGLTMVPRGAGQSYGDLALNDRGAVLSLRGLKRTLEWDPEAGVIRVQAGVTVAEILGKVLPHGWSLPVVPGTSRPTVAGCLAVKVHGKNHWKKGTFADHVEAVTAWFPEEGFRVLHRHDEEFSRVAGGLGLAGVIVDVTLSLERVRSGFLQVRVETAETLDRVLEKVEVGARDWDHAVAWVDCFSSRGRGVLHFARELPPEHPRVGEGLDPETQSFPRRLFGLVPRSQAWRLLRLFGHPLGMRLLNEGRFRAARWKSGGLEVQPLAHFHFLLDSIPGWKRIYAPDGMIQYQLFVDRNRAPETFRRALELQHRTGLRSWLAVVKRHPAPEGSGDYWRDGFSLALDFPGAGRDASGLLELWGALENLRHSVDGGLYPAKDAVGKGTLPVRPIPGFESDLARRWAGS